MRPTSTVPAATALVQRQGGLVTRRQAVALGMTERELRSATAVDGPWVVVRRGAYAPRELWERLDERARWHLRDRAADLVSAVPRVSSHDSAARALGLWLLDARRPLSHVTRVGVSGSRTEHGVKHHLTRRPLVVVEARGLRVTDPVRTALDLAREHGLDHGLVAVDHLLAAGVPRRALEAELATMRSWPGIAAARRAVELGDARAESPAETLGRLLAVEAGLGEVRPQFPLLIAGRTFWSDLLVGRHVIEVDGAGKYVPASAGGLATRAGIDVVRDEVARERLIRGEGFGFSRVVWSDVLGVGRGAAAERLRREVAVTRDRFGETTPPHLLEAARRIGVRRNPVLGTLDAFLGPDPRVDRAG